MRGSNGGRLVRVLEQGGIATLVDGEASEIGEKRGEFPSKFHGKGGGLQRGEQQVGESEYGDVVVTREMIEFVNIRPATFSTSCTYTVINAILHGLRFERVISERKIDRYFFPSL